VLVGVIIFASALQGTYLYSYRQRIVPDQVMGRATSVFRLIAYAGSPLALWVTGLLLQFAGATITVIALLAMILLTAVLVTVNTQVRYAETAGRAGEVPDLV
jgi:MFS-type transporter involved in bile tolerance (Atg22 family)